MGVICEIVFDCTDAPRLARFWVEALDGYRVREYDAAEIARLAERGLTPDTDPCVMVDGPGVALCFQQTDTATAAKNKVHLDVETSARDGLVDRLCEIGASVVERFDSHTWLRDPEGSDFCITDTP
jgi:hypothetical protein